MYPGYYAELTPDKAAIIMAETGETVTYRELDEEANRLSRVLRESGLRPGDHFAFCLENHARLLPIVWGAHYAGLYYTALSPKLTSDEMAYILEDCGATAFVTSVSIGEPAVDAVSRLPQVTLRLMVDGVANGFESYERVVAGASSAPLEDRPEGQDFFYSSGTTGRPKGVQVPLPGTTLGEPEPATELCQRMFNVTDRTVYLSPAPLYHAAPNRFSRSVLRSGGTVVVMERFEPEVYLQTVERYQCTFTQVVPTMFIRMLKLPEGMRTKYDLSSLTDVVHAAAPCPPEVKRQMIEWWGPVIHEFYGGTEANGFIYCNSEEWLAHEGTVGRAISGQIHILDEDGNDVPVGSTGAVFIAGGGNFEYHNDPEKTKESHDPRGRGWSTLGDVGHLDADGFLYLTDRKSYMIIVGGVNVYPQEAENILVMHPAVADVAVLGVPNDDTGEEVKAVVQPVDMLAAGDDLAAELIAYCREHLAPIKCPRSVDFREELPRHATGKLYKRLLKDEYWGTAGRTI
ncbi:AMP-binding protein [Aeromicrobium sp.]|uniref:AMP-binding protein n=1 Tax=Aeromicrobium sp. TaxID=1871063 RepID=UPI002FC73CEE